MASILDRIVSTKLDEIALAKSRVPRSSLDAQLASAPPVRDFLEALSGYDTIRLVAEVKKASPSKGIIRKDFDPVSIAQAYANGGAAALSVLTDATYFQGSLEYLTQIRASVALPILRKEFILDEYQVVEARVAGADAILLIAEILTATQLKQLHDFTRSLGMVTLIEFYDEANLDAVLNSGTSIVGVNNRDLHTFAVDLHHTIRMRRKIPRDRVLVGESGIGTHREAQMLFDAGVQAILVGESLMRQNNVELATRELLRRSKGPD